jgi:hypothetical protein
MMYKAVSGGDEQIMKKILTISMAIMFALTLGIAYAGDMSMSNDISRWNNGVTIFASGPVTTGTNFRTGSLNLISKLQLSYPKEFAFDNGVTLVSNGPVSTGVNYKSSGKEISSEEGMATGGYSGEEAPGPSLYNGVTVFDGGAIHK